MHKSIFFYALVGGLFFLLPASILYSQENDPNALETAPNDTNRISTENTSIDNLQKIYEHWIALGQLYEKQGDTAMANLAYGYAKEFLPQTTDPSTHTQLLPESTLPDNIFLRHLNTYFSGWFENDAQKITSVTAPVLLLPLYSDGLIKEEQEAFFQEFFASYPQFHQLNFEDIYEIETLLVVQFDNSKAMLSIRSRDYPPLVLKEWNYWSNFWHNTHHYFFQKMADNQWYLLAFDMDEEDMPYLSINQEPHNSHGTS